MIANSSKRIFNSVCELRLCFSSKAKAPTHYETLKVAQNSTQDDIKSAYYKLSKKFHPDVNKSADAKKNFQDLSDAYEVLGNFSKRKLYDRDLLARGASTSFGLRKAQTQSQPYTEKREDPLAGFYKARQKDYDPDRERATNRAKFDFDQWTRTHYGNTFRRSLKDKESRLLREELNRQYAKEVEKDKANVLTILSTAVLVLIALSFQAHYEKTVYDRNLLANRKN
ncbi:dnaJ homolog subfamily C member 30, mitochondrial [Nasonia vitripennis]|uniref:J domain-containing protein n=1 Tax=Nasonia vitripennis TaxID=7425 RepID=A0A7M7GCT4_NASVI|nr:dnaJ homolog subfamily C member 30, mitochondrial [Nasonia vitripennis]